MKDEFIKIYKVNAGDCIQLRYYGVDDKYHNIIIDCGYSGTFKNTLDKEITDLINRTECIDLFILTHTHQDHIGGMKPFIRKYGDTDIVKEYWFNGGRFNINLKESGKISIDQGFELEKYLIKTGRCNTEKIVHSQNEYDVFGAKVNIVAPIQETLDLFLDSWNKYDYSSIMNEKITTSSCDWNTDIKDFDLEKYTPDDSIENMVSISFIIEINNIKILFLGDVCSEEVEKSLLDMGYSEENRLEVNYIKISHHASKGNTSDKLLRLVKCNNFIISTNGANRDKFPHKETFSRILRNKLNDRKENIKFIFNYDTLEIKSIFSENDYEEYNFECIYPKEGDNYVSISI